VHADGSPPGLVQARQAEGLKALGDEMGSLLARMTSVTQMLVTTPDANFLMVRLREMQKLKAKIAANCVLQCDTMRAALEVRPAPLRPVTFRSGHCIFPQLLFP
jgi:hypothetical protein